MNRNCEKKVTCGVNYKRRTDNIVEKQEQEIIRLQSELTAVKKERDLLIIEVSKLKFELEIADNSKKLYNIRSVKSNSLSSHQNGSFNDSRNCHNNCDDDEEANSDIDDIAVENFNDSYKNGSNVNDSYRYQHQWHGFSSNNTIRSNATTEMANYSRSGVISYELSQDLLEKQIELLERKYGGTRAREAAIAIQRAFRRYQLIKKFIHITEMVKSEKGQSRRLEGNGSTMMITQSTSVAIAPTQSYENEFSSCEAKNETTCLQSNVTPIRSLSMREKRLGELESCSNSLPRSYVGRCTSCSYCCSMTNSCSPCCMMTPAMNLCSNYYVKQNQSVSPNMVRTYQESYLTACNVTPPIAYINYPSPVTGAIGGYRNYSGQHSYSENPLSLTYQLNSSPSSVSLMSTPKKVPPEVPKRTSSISFRSSDGKECSISGGSETEFSNTKNNGSMSSVRSSSSDSSFTINASHPLSPNRNNCIVAGGATWNKKPPVTETMRKRQYRVGLNLFNKKPEKGIAYLVQKGFLEDTPHAAAKFLIHRKGLSKETIGEYLGGRNQYSQAVLECYMNDIDLSGMQVDVALRKFVTYFKLPGEAQKIERLMKAFSDRYCRCNRDMVARFQDPDTLFVMAFAIIMLNSDQHTPSMKDEQRMKVADFIVNLRRVISYEVDDETLVGIYERIKANEFKDGNDHVSQVRKVESTIVGLKMMLALPHRRLVCYCRLYQVPDVNKKEKSGVHQREVFLFNDLLVITKIFSKKKNAVTYTFRQSFTLSGLHVSVFETQYYQYGIQLTQRVDNQSLITFNARNDHDRTKFVEDIRESIMEMDEMENIRIEAELERQKSSRTNRCSSGNHTENRDSGVADVEICQCLHGYPLQCSYPSEHNTKSRTPTLKRSTRSNSLLDIHERDQG